MGRNGAQRHDVRTRTCGGESGTASETLGTKPTPTPRRNVKRTCPMRSEPSWMRLVSSRLLATSGRMSKPKKERVMAPFNPSCATRTKEPSKRVRQSSATLAVSSSERKEENDDVVAPPQGWDEKHERCKRAVPILARPHVLRRSGRQWQCEVCDKRASGAASCDDIGEHARPQCHLLAQSFVWCCRCGARNLASRVFGIRGLKSTHEASVCCRVAGTPRRIAFLDHPNCSQSKHG